MMWRLRFLVYCRQAVAHLDRIAEAQEQLARIAKDDWEDRNRLRKPQASTFDRADVEAINRRYLTRQSVLRGEPSEFELEP